MHGGFDAAALPRRRRRANKPLSPIETRFNRPAFHDPSAPMPADTPRRPDRKPDDRRTERRPHRRAPATRSHWSPGENRIVIYGVHAVAAALANPARVKHRLVATHNALARLSEAGIDLPVAPEVADPKVVAEMVPADAVHQGIALVTEPLAPAEVGDLGEARLVLALDQVTDPHNVGAIMRSAVALGASALFTTSRHSPQESGVLAKAASGAVDLLPHASVPNLPRTLRDLKDEGFTIIGLDSEAEHDLESVPVGDKVALVLGSEGKGLRGAVKTAADAVARLEAPGPFASLNVSNAAAIALYVMRRRLAGG